MCGCVRGGGGVGGNICKETKFFVSFLALPSDLGNFSSPIMGPTKVTGSERAEES